LRQNGTKRPGTATARDGGALSRDSPRPPQRHVHSSTRARKVTQCRTWAAGQPHGKAGPPWQLRQRHIVTSHTSTLKCTPIQPTAWCCFGAGARLRAQHPIRIDPARPPPGERDAVRPHVAIPAGRPSMQCEPRRVSTLLQNGKRSRVVACQRASTLRAQHPIRHGPPGSVTQCDPTWRSLPAAQVCNAKLGVCPRSCKTENVNVRQHTSAHDTHLGVRLPNPV
jgi:hypothetical protein